MTEGQQKVLEGLLTDELAGNQNLASISYTAYLGERGEVKLSRNEAEKASIIMTLNEKDVGGMLAGNFNCIDKLNLILALVRYLRLNPLDMRVLSSQLSSFNS